MVWLVPGACDGEGLLGALVEDKVKEDTAGKEEEGNVIVIIFVHLTFSHFHVDAGMFLV